MPDSLACPQCGGRRPEGEASDRGCEVCGASVAIVKLPGRGRTALRWMAFTAGCGIVAIGGVMLVVPGPGAWAAVGVVLLLASVAGAVFGLYFCLHALLIPPVVFEPGPPGRLLPADRARAIVRAVAEANRARHLVRQLDGIRPKRIANARARFARGMTDDETPLILADMSALRNGKAGFLLTNRAVYSDRLRTPIPLDQVRSVEHRQPDARLSLLEGGLFLVHLVFPPAALLLIPLGLSQASRRKSALLVNDQVVFAGDKNLAWDFWVTVVPALAAELSRPPAVLLEVFPAEGEMLRMPEPDWPAVERVVRSLNGTTLPLLRLWTPYWATGLEVAGGDGRYAVRPLWGGRSGVRTPADAGAVEVVVGEVISASSVDRVVRIARRFVETGTVQ